MKYTLIIIISLFIYMAYLRNIEVMKENFLSNIHKKKIEHFSEIPGIRDMPDSKEETSDNTSEESEKQNAKESGADETEVQESKETGVKVQDLVSQDTVDKFNEVLSKMATINQESVNANKNNVCSKGNTEGTGKCLFGCPEADNSPIAPSPTSTPENRETNTEEMMRTIEETEKICDLIEEKDRIRKEEEEKEALRKQIELNKSFLIQQKAQNKQIEDLQNIVKEMKFTEKMNESAVEKCGVGADQCLSNKEKKLIELLKRKQEQKKEVKVNLNLDNFGEKFLQQIMGQLNLSGGEMAKLLQAIQSGALDMNQLQNQINNNFNNRNNIGNSEGVNCPDCKIDLSEYIDRCKIPCNKCRDPAWNCPQDIRN